MTPHTSVALQAPMPLFAQDNSGVLPRSFVIAVVLVAPAALWQWRRIRARRLAGLATERAGQPLEPPREADAGAPGPTLEALVTEIGRLGHDLQTGQTTTVRIESGVTVAGRATDRSIVDRLVRDALERSGLETIGSTEVGDDVLLECRKR